MSFDSLSLKSVVLEISSGVAGRTVDRIVEPRAGEFAFVLRDERSTSLLYVSINPSNPFVFHAPQSPSRFDGQGSNYSVLLRKHLAGARVESVAALNDDRILLVRFKSRDQFCERSFSLFFEFMGKHSNSFMASGFFPFGGSGGEVLAAVSGSENLVSFVAAPSKVPVSSVPRAEFEAEWKQCAEKAGLMKKYCGLSPALIAAASRGGGGAIHSLHSARDPESLAAAAGSSGLAYAPAIYRKAPGGGSLFAYPLEIPGAEAVERFGRLNDAYAYLFGAYNRRALARSIGSVISRLKNSAEKKYEAVREEFESSREFERHLIYGKAIIGMLSGPSQADAPRGAGSVETPSGAVPLDSRFGLSDNAQRHFKLYKRLKSRNDHSAKTMAHLEGWLKKLAECSDELASWTAGGGDARIFAIEKNLTAAMNALVSEKRTRKKLAAELAGGVETISSQAGVRREKKKAAAANGRLFRHFESSAGLAIYVGRSDEGNDYVLSRVASQEDYWLHVRDFRGSSVILKVPGGTPEEAVEQSIAEAALYAAHYSQGRNATRIFVSCAKRKHVKKMRRALGKVTFENERAILVDVDRLEAFFGQDVG